LFLYKYHTVHQTPEGCRFQCEPYDLFLDKYHTVHQTPEGCRFQCETDYLFLDKNPVSR